MNRCAFAARSNSSSRVWNTMWVHVNTAALQLSAKQVTAVSDYG